MRDDSIFGRLHRHLNTDYPKVRLKPESAAMRCAIPLMAQVRSIRTEELCWVRFICAILTGRICLLHEVWYP
jgi:hypothetical protein